MKIDVDKHKLLRRFDNSWWWSFREKYHFIWKLISSTNWLRIGLWRGDLYAVRFRKLTPVTLWFNLLYDHDADWHSTFLRCKQNKNLVRQIWIAGEQMHAYKSHKPAERSVKHLLCPHADKANICWTTHLLTQIITISDINNDDDNNNNNNEIVNKFEFTRIRKWQMARS